MKRLVPVLIVAIAPFFLYSCQEKLEWTIDVVAGNIDPSEDNGGVKYPRYEKIMDLSEISPHPQGGDCWGNFFFQFVTNNSAVRVYDLSTRSLVQTIKISGSLKGFVPNCHCNSACFGTEYYDTEDIFPLIYVSTGYASGGYTGALVYRITQEDGRFSVALVQTIKFPADNSTWTEFIPAGEFAYLCYTSERLIFKVAMPKLNDGDIIISRDDAIEAFQFTPQPDWMSTSRNQDRLFYHGKILFVSGVPQVGEASAFVVLNLETQERERIIDFQKIGLQSESESLFVWQGNLCVAFVDKIVKLIGFIDTP